MEFTLDWNIFQKFLNKPKQRESGFGGRLYFFKILYPLDGQLICY